MKTKFLTVTALLCCFGVYVTAANITGNWSGSVKTADGDEVPIKYTFKADSGKITGVATAPQGSMSISNGEITGDEFSFGVPVTKKLNIEHTGKYFSTGDSVSLDIDFNGQLLHTTLKRADK